jgi:amino acid transporter
MNLPGLTIKTLLRAIKIITFIIIFYMFYSFYNLIPKCDYIIVNVLVWFIFIILVCFISEMLIDPVCKWVSRNFKL